MKKLYYFDGRNVIALSIALCTLILYSSYCTLSFSYAKTEEEHPQVDKDKYAIEIQDIEIELPSFANEENNNVVGNDGLKIYARIYDKYGKLVDGLLMYSTSGLNNISVRPMELINGLPSNGTFVGTIARSP